MRKILPQDFATLGNYPAGPDDWSGQPRSVILSDSAKLDGFGPNLPIPAEVQNGLFQELFEGVSVQAIGALKAWKKSTFDGALTRTEFLVSPSNPSGSQRFIVGLGFVAADTHRAQVRSFGGGEFEATSAQFDATLLAAGGCAAGRAGEYMYPLAGGLTLVTGLGAASAVFTTSFNPIAMHYLAASNTYLAAQSNGSMDFYVGNLVSAGPAPFTNTPVSPAATAFNAGAVGVAGGEFADDGGSNVVLACSSTVGGVVRFRIFRSGNAGATWTTALTLGAGPTGLSVAWSSYYGCFVALASDGAIYTSADGASFTLLRTSTITAANGASVRHGTLAAQGACLVKSYSPTVYGFPSTGVVYSFDLGATWRKWTFGDTDAFGSGYGIYSVIGANGRFYATDRKAVYMSGSVVGEDYDYT